MPKQPAPAAPSADAEPDYPLSFQSPESLNITEARYDPDTETMTVAFKTGKTYAYHPIPETLWREFTQATSKGGFFAARVRPFHIGKQRGGKR